jgi:hypothetical protein
MIDLDRLFKLRLVVGRHGEMDRAGWWNTNSMLGRRGAIAVARGLPRTHRFACARVVFAVASARCKELYDPPGSVTLWSLPAVVEDAFEERWAEWTASPADWNPFIDDLANGEVSDLVNELATRDLIVPEQAEQVASARRSAEGRAVELAATELDNDLLGLLAAGFVKGEGATPTIPFARLAT